MGACLASLRTSQGSWYGWRSVSGDESDGKDGRETWGGADIVGTGRSLRGYLPSKKQGAVGEF